MAHAMAALRVKFCEASWECGWGLKVIPGSTVFYTHTQCTTHIYHYAFFLDLFLALVVPYFLLGRGREYSQFRIPAEVK